MFGLIVFFKFYIKCPWKHIPQICLWENFAEKLCRLFAFLSSWCFSCSLCVVLAGSVDTQGQPLLMCCSVRYSWLGDGCKSTDKMTFSLMNDGQGGHYFELLAKLCADTTVWFCMAAGVLFGSWKIFTVNSLRFTLQLYDKREKYIKMGKKGMEDGWKQLKMGDGVKEYKWEG